MTAYMNHKDLANEIIDQSRAQEITDGVHRVLDRIAAAESMAGREAGSVQLLAATKTRDVGEIMAAIGAGIHLIGEATGGYGQGSGIDALAFGAWNVVGRDWRGWGFQRRSGVWRCERRR